MKKGIMALGMTALLAAVLPVTASAQETISNEVIIKVNGYTINMYEAPAYIDSKVSLTYVPLRFVSEALGAEIEWVDEKTPITTTIDEPEHHEVKVLLGDNRAEIDGKIKDIDGLPVLQNGRTMVPLRVISEGLGAEVKWTPAEGGGGTVDITTPWETPKPAESDSWKPTPHQKQYAQEVFKDIRFDIKNSNLKVKVPSMEGKDVTAGLTYNGEKQGLKLDTLHEFKDAKSIKLAISISGEYEGFSVSFDNYTIYSRDMLPPYADASKIADNGDLIVYDQFGTTVSLSAVLKALETK